MCVCVCLSFRCQPYLRNRWSICYHIWYDDCLSYENASHIIILDLEWNNSAIWKNTPITHLCGTSRSAQAHKDMLTHITLIASMFFRKTCGVWLSHSNLTQATWVHQKCTICLRFFGFFWPTKQAVSIKLATTVGHFYLTPWLCKRLYGLLSFHTDEMTPESETMRTGGRTPLFQALLVCLGAIEGRGTFLSQLYALLLSVQEYSHFIFL